MMNSIHTYRKFPLGFRLVAGFLTLIFGLNTLIAGTGYAQSAVGLQASWPGAALGLPAPGAMIYPTPAFNPPLIKGLTIYPDNPFQFDFIVDTGDDHLQGKALETESNRLIKYFLASLTVPEDEMWVNLSPYEKNRIIPAGFGQTEMGRDLLAQDYLLKQLTASLMYPEEELGKEFWTRVYQKAQAQYGTSDIPMNTFNKIWIVPERAEVYVHGQSAFVMNSHLKVMLEEDYLALEANKNSAKHGLGNMTIKDVKVVSGETSAVVREVLIPEIEREVNEGKLFANLRQIYHASILAAWFKQNLKKSVLGQMYIDQNKTKGVDIENAQEQREQIYEQYVAAFKKGVFDLIKEEYDPTTQQVISHKYFSGGVVMGPGAAYKERVASSGVNRAMSVTQRELREAFSEIDGPFQERFRRITANVLGRNLKNPLVRWAANDGGDDRVSLQEVLQKFSPKDREIIEDFDRKTGMFKVVDMGSSIGEFIEVYLKQHPDHVMIGYDNEERLAEIIARLDKVVLGDAGKTGLTSESVDIVTINMINYARVLSDIPGMLKEAFRILKPGGQIILTMEGEDLNDPIQRSFVRLAKRELPGMFREFQTIKMGPLSEIEPSYPKTFGMRSYEEDGIGVTAFKAVKPAQVSSDVNADQAMAANDGGDDRVSLQEVLQKFSPKDRGIIEDFNERTGIVKVVDAGSQRGQFLELYLKQHPDHVGIGYEIDSVFAEVIARKNNVVFGDAGETGLTNGSIDKYVINLPDPYEVLTVMPHLLNEAKRILKPGGSVTIVLQASKVNDLFGGVDVENAGNTILEILEELGFKVQHVGKSLNQVYPDYPKTGLMESFERKAGLNLFEAVKPADAAMAAETNKGGIDLNPAMMKLQTNGEVPVFNLPADGAPIPNFNLDGLNPVIINIAPVTNFYQLLGIKEEDAEEQQVSLN